MQTKDVEQLLGLSKQTLIYYEKEGLIHPSRSDNGYRQYSQKDVHILKFVQLLRSMELSIDEVKFILDGQLSLRDALDTKKEWIQKTKIKYEDIDQQINQYIKREKTKVSFNQQPIENYSPLYTLFMNQDSIDYQDIHLPLETIRSIHLSMCSSADLQRLPFVYLNYYVDIDIKTDYDTYSFQIMNNQNVYQMFQYFQEHQLMMNDPLDLMSLYLEKKDLVIIHKYLDRHFKKWAKQYHLDNPRNSVFDRMKKEDPEKRHLSKDIMDDVYEEIKQRKIQQ